MGATGSPRSALSSQFGLRLSSVFWVITSKPVVFIRVLFKVGMLFISIKISFSIV